MISPLRRLRIPISVTRSDASNRIVAAPATAYSIAMRPSRSPRLRRSSRASTKMTAKVRTLEPTNAITKSFTSRLGWPWKNVCHTKAPATPAVETCGNAIPMNTMRRANR